MTHRPDRHRRVLLGSACALCLAACGGGAALDEPPPTAPRFDNDGLAGRIVRRLKPAPPGLLAASEDGLWLRRDGTWRRAGLDGETVLDVVTAGARWFAALAPAESRPAGALVESDDEGGRWRPVPGHFGSDGEAGTEREAVRALAWVAATGELYATGADVLAVSRDGGRRWQRLAGQWLGFAQPKDTLAIDPASGDAWYGGQDAIEGFALFRRRAAGGALDTYPGLLPAPSVVKGFRFLAAPAPRLWAAGEGGLVASDDDGGRWTVAHHDDYRFFFDVLQDPQRPQRLVTASWEKNFDTPQRLNVDVSDDGGQRWRRFVHADPSLFGGAWSMAVAVERGLTVYRFGLYRGGVVSLRLPERL